MKNKVLKVSFIVVVVLIAGQTMYVSQMMSKGTLSKLAIENVEALADNEDTGANSPCYTGSYDSKLPEATKCAHPCIKERCGGEVDKCY